MKLSRIASRFADEPGDDARIDRFLHRQPGLATYGAILTPGDFDWWIAKDDDPEKLHKLRLWLDGYEVVAWVWPDGGASDLFYLPRYQGLLPEMVAWAEESARTSGAATATIVANDRDLPRHKALYRAGFEQTEEHYVYRRRSLKPPIEELGLPDGYEIIDMKGAGEEEIAERVELHRAVWAPSKMTLEKHHRVMSSRNYRADLDLVVTAPGGEMVAYTIVWHEPIAGFGVFEPVGCHPDYRRRGLTSAVMREGLRLLQERGAQMAFVNSWHANEASNRLYESLGFEIVDRQRKWTKVLM